MPPPPMPSAPSRGAASGELPARVQLPMVVAAVVGLVLAVFASSLVWRWEKRTAHLEFTTATQSQVAALQRGIDEYLNQLQALRALFEASDDVTRYEFESFAGRLLVRQKAIQNLSWVPRVKREERTDHEMHGLAEGINDYRIRAITPDGRITVSPEKDEYLPIFYSSLPVTSRIYGVDLMSQPPIREHLERARDEDALSAIPDFVLHSRTDDVHGFLFSLPVYRRHMPHDTVEQRRAALAGFAHGAFVTGVAMEQVLGESARARGLNVYLFVADAPDDARPIYALGAAVAPHRDAVTLGSIRSDWHSSGPLSAGAAQWLLVAAVLLVALAVVCLVRDLRQGPPGGHHHRGLLAWLLLGGRGGRDAR